MLNDIPITKADAIKQVTAQLDGAIALSEFTERVLAIWSSKAKNPAAGIRQTVRWDEAGKTLIFLDDQTIIPIQNALQGVRFRITLSRQEIKRGLLNVYPNFTCFVPHQVSPETVELVDATGQPISTQLVSVKQTHKSIFGVHTSEHPAFSLSQYFKKWRVKRDDSLLITIEDWEANRFRLIPEPAKVQKRRRAEIKRQNQELAGLLFDMLETARYEYIWGQQAVLTAYARLAGSTGYPGDHWLKVLEQDGRMDWNGYEIRYAGNIPPFERLLMDPGEPPPLEEMSYSRHQANQVYRLKVALWHHKSFWRRIEIEGGQTLAEFDSELREAFKHDPMDHLSGFWKLIRRGQSRRFREVDLGHVDPLGEGGAAELHIAGLGLEPGHQLKYVYDFGDWVEHRITVEAITEPEDGASYPRVVGQNKPRYQYCRHCKKEGRKTIATWICSECSSREDDVLVCGDCLDTHHLEHYADELLY